MQFGGSSSGEFCFIHAADLHLGARLWLRSAPVHRGFAERVKVADRLALRALVDLCLDERAALLLCAGDLIDGWCRNHTVGLSFVQQLLRLRDSGCEVALLLGNHDVRTRVTRQLLLPRYAYILGVGRPETRVVEPLGVALHGWSSPEPEQPADIAALYPSPVPGLFNIGLLHTSAEGRKGHANYAPCSRRTLRRHGYDYWALGHVHTREVIAEKPWIVFPRNLQGRGLREAGPKGATLVRVRGGRVVSVEHRSLDALRFETVIADVSRADNFDDVLDSARAAIEMAKLSTKGPPVVARLVLAGGAACALRVPFEERSGALGALARQYSGDSLWLAETWLDAGAGGSWLVDVAA